eukprot:4158359-Amphidinium_carterae.2
MRTVGVPCSVVKGVPSPCNSPGASACDGDLFVENTSGIGRRSSRLYDNWKCRASVSARSHPQHQRRPTAAEPTFPATSSENQ